MVKLTSLLPKKLKSPKSSGEKKLVVEEKKKSWQKALKDDDDVPAPEAAQLSDLSASTDDGVGDHVENIDANHSESAQKFERRLRTKHSKGCKAMATGSYHAALEEFESILSELLTRYGEKHERVGAALHNVAIANLRAGSLDDALDAIEEAIKIRSRSLGRSHSKVADSLVELGIILLSMEEHEDALKVFERALKLRKDEAAQDPYSDDGDESKLKVAKVHNNIGCVNFEKGDLVAARKSFDSAIDLQKSVFANWYTFVCGMDMTSPGVLTMASTMCNKGYVENDQGQYQEAIKIFEESLKIQKTVLGIDNKLVRTSLDNLGFAYSMVDNKDMAIKIYNEMWDAQKKSNDSLEDKTETVRKLVICYVRQENWPKAFEFLEPLEDMYRELDDESKELYDTRKLMGEVNYEILKLPSLSDATNNALGCVICVGPPEEGVGMAAWTLDKPENTSKMSGHRVTHA